MFNNVSINVVSDYYFNFRATHTASLPYRIITFPYQLIATPTLYTWGVFKTLFLKRSQICRDIAELTCKMNANYAWTESEKNLINSAINSVDYEHMKKDLTLIFKRANPLVVTEIIKKGILHGLDQDKEKLNLRPFDLIDQNQLLMLSQTNSERLKTEIQAHAALVKNSMHNPLADIVAAKYRKVIPTIFHYFHKIVDILIAACGLESLDSALEHGYPIAYIFEMLKEIVIMPILLFGVLTPTLGFWSAFGATAGITITFIIAAVVYAEFFRPCPEKIGLGENMTLLAKKGEYEPVVAREKEIEDLMNALSSHERAIIIGKSGVGKTELVKLLAQKIINKNVPEFLKDKTIFHLNTAEFAGEDGIAKLRQIQNILQGYEKQVILFFDEIHIACTPENRKLANFLKTFCQRFMTIGATTDQEYALVQTDGAFRGRFQEVKINPTNDEQTQTVVFEYFRRLLPNVEISLENVKLIVELTNQLDVKRNQPDRAKNAVYGIVARLQNHTCPQLNEVKAELLSKEKLLEKQFTFGAQVTVNDQLISEQEDLKNRIKIVDGLIAAKAKKIEKIQWFQALRRQIRLDNHQMAIEMAEQPMKPRQLNEMKAKWLIENRFILPELTQFINTKAREIPEASLQVTEQLIRDVVRAMAA